MAAVLEKKSPAAKYESVVDEQIAQATSRVRTHDLALGGLVLAALVLVYATAMILLDKYVVLPEWVRQVALVAFAATLAGVAYRMIVRPLRRRVNPLYAAVLVEKTIDDAKNSVAGYVEAQEKGDVHPAVRAAMGAKAAKSVGDADVNRAVDHRGLVYAGAVAVAFLLALVVLFFAFRPAQFASLAGRAFVPFSSDPIRSRTELTLVEPAGGDATITAGQSVAVRVTVGGRVPAADGPDRVRVRLRHAPTATEYEELPLEKGDTSREWSARIPDHLVRNGFWYRVAGGDYESPEYRVTVRSLPLFTDFEVRYDYPAYIRRPPQVTKDPTPNLEGIRGTKVTLTGKTNRTAKDGRLAFDPPGREPVAGRPVADRPDSLAFEFHLTTSGTYRLAFTSSENERSVETQPFDIRVLEDSPPQIDVVKPEPEEISLPANGQLAVDARIGDDFGIDKVRLKLKLVGPAAHPLADRPYQDGKSFRRAADNTWPTVLEYKDSADLTKLTDEGGAAVELKEGMLLEYWLEATDNRTRPGPTGPEPDPNVGTSIRKRVRITPAVVAKEDRANLDQRRETRKTEEKTNAEKEQQRLDTERRDPQPPQAPKPDDPKQTPEAKQDNPKPEQKEKGAEPKDPPMPKEGQPENGAKQPPEAQPDSKKNDTQPMPKEGQPMPKEGQPEKGAENPMPGGSPMPNENGGMGEQPQTAPPPSDAGTQQANEQARKDAERVQQELDRQNEKNNGAGESKPGPAEDTERTPPADAKPPMPNDAQPGAEQKTEPQPGDPKPTDGGKPDPKNGSGTPEPKNGGTPEQNPGAPDQKAQPKPQPDPMGGDKPSADQQPAPRNDQPGGGTGSDKPKPQPADKPDPQNPRPDQSAGGEGKPGTQQKTPDSGSQPMPGAEQSKNPADDAGRPKPTPKNDPGSDKPAGDPMGGTEPNGGEPKPQQSPKAGAQKPGPKEDSPTPGEGATGQKPTPPEGQPNDPMNGQTKPTGENKQPGTAGSSPRPEKGPNSPAEDKPTPDQKAQAGGSGEQPKLSPEQKKDLENAARDLNSPDPDKRKAAQDKLDKTIGEKNRKAAEDIAKGLNSNDPKEREAAEQKLNDLAEQAKADGQQPKDGKKPKDGSNTAKGSDAGKQPKPDPKDVADAIKDLNSPDPQKRQAARDKLDKAAGPDARKEAEELLNDLKSGDPDRQAKAQKKLDDIQKKAEENAKQGGDPKDGQAGKGANDKEPKPEQTAGGKKGKVVPKEVEQALEDLKSPDEKTRQAAKQKVDDALGKGAGDRAEQQDRDMKSPDLEKQGQARADRDKMMKQAEDMAKGQPKGQEPTKEELDELANKAKDLNSPDPAKREAAEKALDDKLGKESRQKLQDAMKDPKKAEELRKELDEMAKNGRGGKDPPDQSPRNGGSSDVPLNEAMKEDARNRAKSAQLQLEQFEKNRDNKALLDRLGWTQERYEEFVQKFRDEAGRLKKTADDLDAADAARPKTPPAVNVSTGGKVGAGPKAAAGTGSAGGPVFAAPGYGDALKLFQQGATRVPAKKP